MTRKQRTANGKRHTKALNIRLEVEVLNELRKMAQLEHRTVTNLVQVLVEHGMRGRHQSDITRAL